jgi:hypothetical protein
LKKATTPAIMGRTLLCLRSGNIISQYKAHLTSQAVLDFLYNLVVRSLAMWLRCWQSAAMDIGTARDWWLVDEPSLSVDGTMYPLVNTG